MIANPLLIGRNYCLRLPDGRALGHVRIERCEENWAEGPFCPSALFENYRPLFDREARLRRAQVIPLWEQAADEIEALGIQVVEEGNEMVQAHLKVFVEGDEAILGLS
jgi:hypothetical protein